MPEDVIKLGRVRFKVREIKSPAYKKLRGSLKLFNSSQGDHLLNEVSYAPDPAVELHDGQKETLKIERASGLKENYLKSPS
jgi:hypothetical protein